MKCVVLLGIWYASVTEASKGGGSCGSNVDCNWGGWCTDGTCKCDYGWTGATCDTVNVGQSWKCGEGGLCAIHETPEAKFDNMTTSWGGGVVSDGKGKYHMFAAGMRDTCPLSTWLTNSIVVHATATSPQGPYILSDISLDTAPYGEWDALVKHNPTIVRSSNGTYLMYYMGTQAKNITVTDCNAHLSAPNCSTNADLQPACMQRVGLATSDSPYGPWTHQAPILEPGPPGAWDDAFTTNPTVHIFPNDSVLVVYKARDLVDAGMRTGVAYADHWAGEYKRAQPSLPFNISAHCEDAGMYYSEAMDVFRLVLHCGCNYQYMWSRNGINWTAAGPEQPWCNVTYTDNTTEQFARRERPQWLLQDGHPTVLFNGVSAKDADGQTWTLATQILP